MGMLEDRLGAVTFCIIFAGIKFWGGAMKGFIFHSYLRNRKMSRGAKKSSVLFTTLMSRRMQATDSKGSENYI